MSQFFRMPYNFMHGATSYEADASWNQGDPASEISDGRIDTYSTSDRYLIDFEGTDRKRIDAIFLITASTRTNVSLTWDTGLGSGGSLTNFVLPDTVGGQSLRRGRLYYNHVPLFTMHASRVRLSFGGSGRVYGVMLTQQFLTLTEDQHWIDIEHTRIVEGADRRVNLNGRAVVITPRYAEGKWQSRYTGYFPANANPSLDETIQDLEENLNFFYWQQPINSPTWFYPATLDPVSMRVSYVGRLLSQREVTFTIQES